MEPRIIGAGQKPQIGPPANDEVQIGPNGFIMPLNRILLVRKSLEYCAIKFTEFGKDDKAGNQYAKYESYYQGDKTGNFAKANVKKKEAILFSPKPKWSIFGHPIVFGANEEIQCGSLRLWWTGKGALYFFRRYQQQGDYGLEFSPTIWTDISKVNVFDARLKWYGYDESRQRVNIPIEKLFEMNNIRDLIH